MHIVNYLGSILLNLKQRISKRQPSFRLPYIPTELALFHNCIWKKGTLGNISFAV